MTIALVDCGRGNLRSVERALIAAGQEPVRTSDPEVVGNADKLVVPGQGAFAGAMRALRDSGLDEAIRAAIAAGKPYFGICLGLQLLYEASDEHGPVEGLGILKGRVERLETDSEDPAHRLEHRPPARPGPVESTVSPMGPTSTSSTPTRSRPPIGRPWCSSAPTARRSPRR